MVHLGALTTIFTPPAKCGAPERADVIRVMGCGQPSCGYWLAGGRTDDGEIDCFPSNYNPTTGNYYSPAPFCPDGFSVACTTTNKIDSVSETVYTCCPTTALGYEFTCTSHPAYRGLPCHITFPATDTSRTFYNLVVQNSPVPDTTWTVDTTTMRDAMLWAYGVEVRFQAQDLEPTEDSGSKTPSSALAPSTPRPRPEDPGATNSQSTGEFTQSIRPSQSSQSAIPDASNNGNDPSNNGLSVGAVAGIAVGATVISFALIAWAAYVFCIARKRENRAQAVQTGSVSELADNATFPPPRTGSYTGYHQQHQQQNAVRDSRSTAPHYSPYSPTIGASELPRYASSNGNSSASPIQKKGWLASFQRPENSAPEPPVHHAWPKSEASSGLGIYHRPPELGGFPPGHGQTSSPVHGAGSPMLQHSGSPVQAGHHWQPPPDFSLYGRHGPAVHGPGSTVTGHQLPHELPDEASQLPGHRPPHNQFAPGPGFI